MTDTRQRILDVAREVLGARPESGMAEVASAAGVVRRTVYGHFPSRSDLLLALTRQAVREIAHVLANAEGAHEAADEVWAAFIKDLWPVSQRYRVLVALRRGEYGEAIHAALHPIETNLAELIRRGQSTGVFGKHLSADLLSQIAWSTVFAIASDASPNGPGSVQAATITSLLLLGVPETRSRALADRTA